VQGAVLAHGQGRALAEPRMHLMPPNDGAGHFNVLRGHLGVSGIKVVGDFVANYQRGLPSELGLLTLYDPETGIPLAIMDATPDRYAESARADLREAIDWLRAGFHPYTLNQAA